MYHQGQIPAFVSMKEEEAKKGQSKLPGGRKINWKKPLKSLDFAKYMPIFGTGLREKVEP